MYQIRRIKTTRLRLGLGRSSLYFCLRALRNLWLKFDIIQPSSIPVLVLVTAGPNFPYLVDSDWYYYITHSLNLVIFDEEEWAIIFLVYCLHFLCVYFVLKGCKKQSCLLYAMPNNITSSHHSMSSLLACSHYTSERQQDWHWHCQQEEMTLWKLE
jgi:hypothetical protein